MIQEFPSSSNQFPLAYFPTYHCDCNKACSPTFPLLDAPIPHNHESSNTNAHAAKILKAPSWQPSDQRLMPFADDTRPAHQYPHQESIILQASYILFTRRYAETQLYALPHNLLIYLEPNFQQLLNLCLGCYWATNILIF